MTVLSTNALAGKVVLVSGGTQGVGAAAARTAARCGAEAVVVTGRRPEVAESLVDELDQRPKQINISAVIGEVTLADGVEFGIDWLLRPTELKYNGDKTAVGAGAIRYSGNSIVDPSSIETLADLAEIGNGLNFYGTVNDHVSVILNALQSNTAFKVISRPSVFTVNNKSATISSGTSIPVPTQTFSSFNGGVDGNQGLTSNIAYQDIALSLEVLPLINSDDELTLQIFQQNNEQSGTTTINGTPYPTISNQQVNTTVMVKNWTDPPPVGCMRTRTGVTPLSGPSFGL
jgi:type II secretory pathway component GspD/PulD (secretin)